MMKQNKQLLIGFVSFAILLQQKSLKGLKKNEGFKLSMVEQIPEEY